MNSGNLDRLTPSDPDMQHLVRSVAERIRTVSEMYQRQWRTPINTKLITRDLERFNVIMERYHISDFRHTESEKKAVRTLAQWTIDQKAALVGQPTKKLTWKD
jgi:hypothetical protein